MWAALRHLGRGISGLLVLGAGLTLLQLWLARNPDPPVFWICVLGVLQLALLLAATWLLTRRAKADYEHNSQQQSDFVDAVSHEFRSPLTTIRHLTELLAQDRLPSHDLRRKCFDHIERECNRLNALVEDLLDFGHIEGHRKLYNIQRADLCCVVRDALTEFQQDPESVGHFFELKESSGPLMANVDAAALRRALRNLFENAVKYSAPGQTISITASSAGGLSNISVRDEGIGIPHDEQGAIFQKFVRGDAARKQRIKGTGIGLALVKSVIEAHGGRVSVESEPGHGSTFTLTLPS